MKTILKIILILTALITISCDNMYNDVAYEINAEYNYFLAVSQRTSNGRIFVYSLNDSGSHADLYGLQQLLQIQDNPAI